MIRDAMKRRSSVVDNSSKQSGAALLVGLVFLLLLTLLGLTSSNVAMMQERMAGNYVQANQAFQSSESALRAIESRVFNDVCLGGGSGGLGAIPNMQSLPIEPNDCVLAGLTLPVESWALAPIDQPEGDGWARYYIARLPLQPRCSPANSARLGGGQSVRNESYAILASGRAVSGTSEAIVQSIFSCLQ